MTRDHLQDIAAQASERLDVPVSETNLSLIERIADYASHGLRKRLQVRLAGANPFNRSQQVRGHVLLWWFRHIHAT